MFGLGVKDFLYRPSGAAAVQLAERTAFIGRLVAADEPRAPAFGDRKRARAAGSGHGRPAPPQRARRRPHPPGPPCLGLRHVAPRGPPCLLQRRAGEAAPQRHARAPDRRSAPRAPGRGRRLAKARLKPFPRERDCAACAVESMLWKRRTVALDSSSTSPETPANAGTLVLAGGQALVRAARRSVLSRAGLDVVADVSDASRAAEAAELYGAALVLVDSGIPGGCILAVRRIGERAPGT